MERTPHGQLSLTLAGFCRPALARPQVVPRSTFMAGRDCHDVMSCSVRDGSWEGEGRGGGGRKGREGIKGRSEEGGRED